MTESSWKQVIIFWIGFVIATILTHKVLTLMFYI